MKWTEESNSKFQFLCMQINRRERKKNRLQSSPCKKKWNKWKKAKNYEPVVTVKLINPQHSAACMHISCGGGDRPVVDRYSYAWRMCAVWQYTWITRSRVRWLTCIGIRWCHIIRRQWWEETDIGIAGKTDVAMWRYGHSIKEERIACRDLT